MASREEFFEALRELSGWILCGTLQVWHRFSAERHTTSKNENILVRTENSPPMNPPSLRPPTLMIDLLFGALMLFAFHMGDPNARTVVSQNFDLPTSAETTGAKGEKLLAAVPIKSGNTWKYELAGGKRVGAKQVLKIAQKRQHRLVLVVAPGTPIQTYLEAELPFRKLGVKVGLAVERKGDPK